MPDDLNPALALAKQSLDALLGITTLDELSRNEFGDGPKRDRIAELLKKLTTVRLTRARLQ